MTVMMDFCLSMIIKGCGNMEKIENLKYISDLAGSRASRVELQLMRSIDLPLIDRHKLEIQLHELRLEQAKYNLKYQEMLQWLTECHRTKE
jgi:hypothetical protein